MRNPQTGLWTKRDTSTGRFASMRQGGGTFKGVKREGGSEGWDVVLGFLGAVLVLAVFFAVLWWIG